MKPVLILLALSLLANAVLALRWLRPPGSSLPSPDSAAAASPAKAAVPNAAAVASAALQADPQLAAAIQAGDPHQLLPALRQAGFPDSYVRDIILGMANDTRSPERLELLRKTADLPAWVTDADPQRASLLAAARQLDTAGRQMARDVYGETPPAHPLESDWQQERFRFLPADKVNAVARIDSDYNELLREARREGPAGGMADKVRLLEQERRADLAAVLSPAELETYDLNVSNTANSMRYSLSTFEPTEAEFRAIFALRRELDDKYNYAFSAPGPGMLEQAQADGKAVNDKIRGVLGDARYAQYERAQDYGYLTAREIVQHYGLPVANADAVYDLQKSTQQRLSDLRRSSGNDRETLRTATDALAIETNTRLTELLGDKGLDAYRRTGGTWLRNLSNQAGRGSTFPPRPPGG